MVENIVQDITIVASAVTQACALWALFHHDIVIDTINMHDIGVMA